MENEWLVGDILANPTLEWLVKIVEDPAMNISPHSLSC
jgi:hypothetical protein